MRVLLLRLRSTLYCVMVRLVLRDRLGLQAHKDQLVRLELLERLVLLGLLVLLVLMARLF
jgi:hypothetical protein